MFRIFEMLDAKIASTLDKIIHNSYFKNKVSLDEQKAQKEDRLLRAHDTALDCADLFIITLRSDDVQDSIRDGAKFFCR